MFNDREQNTFYYVFRLYFLCPFPIIYSLICSDLSVCVDYQVITKMWCEFLVSSAFGDIFTEKNIEELVYFSIFPLEVKGFKYPP